jgi:hypothetical protein
VVIITDATIAMQINKKKIFKHPGGEQVKVLYYFLMWFAPPPG